jgi:hypothetical protein
VAVGKLCTSMPVAGSMTAYVLTAVLLVVGFGWSVFGPSVDHLDG